MFTLIQLEYILGNQKHLWRAVIFLHTIALLLWLFLKCCCFVVIRGWRETTRTRALSIAIVTACNYREIAFNKQILYASMSYNFDDFIILFVAFAELTSKTGFHQRRIKNLFEDNILRVIYYLNWHIIWLLRLLLNRSKLARESHAGPNAVVKGLFSHIRPTFLLLRFLSYYSSDSFHKVWEQGNDFQQVLGNLVTDRTICLVSELGLVEVLLDFYYLSSYFKTQNL